jgi:hypothetical protein
MVDINCRFKKNPQIMQKELADGPALIDPYRRVLIQLNPTGVEIWELLNGERSILDITDALRERFEVGDETLKKDVVSFLKELFRREMIR